MTAEVSPSLQRDEHGADGHSHRGDSLAVVSLCEAFQNTVAACGEEVALRACGGAQEITWQGYGDRVRRIAGGLASLGVGPGDTIGIMLVNRPEFALVDTAALHLGAVPFSLYNTSSPEQIGYLLGDAGAGVVVTEQLFLARIHAAATSARTIVSVDGGTDRRSDMLTLDELERRADEGFDFDASWRAVTGDDLLTLIYTSGTTGPPKGVELTHASMLAELRAAAAVLPVRPGDRTLSYLPSAYAADRWSGLYTAMRSGHRSRSCQTPRPWAQRCPRYARRCGVRSRGCGRSSRPGSRPSDHRRQPHHNRDARRRPTVRHVPRLATPRRWRDRPPSQHRSGPRTR